jgi:hypothetical protein
MFHKEELMDSLADRLPEHFPVGTRYVVEGRRGGHGRLRVCLRYLVLPDGRQIDLPIERAPQSGARDVRARRRAGAQKKF